MGVLRLLLNGPFRKRMRMLQARLELLASRVEHLEQVVAAASFPDSDTRQRISALIGRSITVETAGAALNGTLVSVRNDALDLIDESGQHVIVPTAKVTAMRV